MFQLLLAAGLLYLLLSANGFDFIFNGLVEMAGPLRPLVPKAVQECQAAGIRVVMIIGDHPATARATAAQAGILNAEGAITGAELAGMADDELRHRAATFTALVACSVTLIVANRSLTGPVLAGLLRPNPAFWRMLAATGTLMAAVLWVPLLRTLFGLEPLPAPLLGASLALLAGVMTMLTILRRWQGGLKE